MPSEAYKRLSASLAEALEHAQGKRELRTVRPTRPRGVRVVLERDGVPPIAADAPNAREVRESTGLSQTEFADLFGVSLGAVTKWEQGQRVPRGPAASLLRVIAAEPDVVVRALRQPAAAKRTAPKEARKPKPTRPTKKAPTRGSG